VQGKRHGAGTQNWADGRTYNGQWELNKRHGQGKYSKPDGEVYEGQWASHKRNGKGSQVYLSGSSYDGEWQDDLKHGWGMFKWKDGSSYEGAWAEDKMSGRGTFKEANGRSFLGEYNRGRFIRRLASLGHAGPTALDGDATFNEAERAEAAAKIQKIARSKKAKKRVKAKKKAMEASYEKKDGLADREWTEDEQKAAAKIQAGQRGKKARKKKKKGKTYERSAKFVCGDMELMLHGDSAFVAGDFKIKLASKHRGGSWYKQEGGDIALDTPKQGTGIVVLELDSADSNFTVAAANTAEWLLVTP